MKNIRIALLGAAILPALALVACDDKKQSDAAATDETTITTDGATMDAAPSDMGIDMPQPAPIDDTAPIDGPIDGAIETPATEYPAMDTPAVDTPEAPVADDIPIEPETITEDIVEPLPDAPAEIIAPADETAPVDGTGTEE